MAQFPEHRQLSSADDLDAGPGARVPRRSRRRPRCHRPDLGRIALEVRAAQESGQEAHRQTRRRENTCGQEDEGQARSAQERPEKAQALTRSAGPRAKGLIGVLGIHDYWLFVLAGVLLNLTPGQDTFYILGSSIAQGRRVGVASALGICSGCVVHTLAAAAGLSAILATSATAFIVVKLVGAAYLI